MHLELHVPGRSAYAFKSYHHKTKNPPRVTGSGDAVFRIHGVE
jgi:hypothetical protein